MEKTIQITKCEVFKTGNTNNKDWTIFKVQCSNDDEMREFTTFNNLQDLVGQQYKSHFEYSEQYKNWSEISTSKAKENEKHNEIMSALRELYSLIAEVNRAVVPQPEEHLKEGEPEIPIHDEVGVSTTPLLQKNN